MLLSPRFRHGWTYSEGHPEDIAPRIKKLRAEIQDLQEQRAKLIDAAGERGAAVLELADIKAHVADLRALLAQGSIVQQKSFLRSFIKRIEVDLPDVAIEYSIPLPQEKAEPLEREVLPIEQGGSPYWGII